MHLTWDACRDPWNKKRTDWRAPKMPKMSSSGVVDLQVKWSGWKRFKTEYKKAVASHHYGRITWSRFSQSTTATTAAASSFWPHFLITLLASLAPLAPRSSSSWLARAKFKDLCSMVVARGNSSSSSFPRFSQFNYTSTMCQHMLCDSQVPRQ